MPYILTATAYGVGMADYYTLAWMDRYVHPDPVRNRSGHDLLVNGPTPTTEEQAAGVVPPWRANLMSARFQGAFSLTQPAAASTVDKPGKRKGQAAPAVAPSRLEVLDLRSYAGLSPVGDWAGANADRPAVAAPNG